MENNNFSKRNATLNSFITSKKNLEMKIVVRNHVRYLLRAAAAERQSGECSCALKSSGYLNST